MGGKTWYPLRRPWVAPAAVAFAAALRKIPTFSMIRWGSDWVGGVSSKDQIDSSVAVSYHIDTAEERRSLLATPLQSFSGLVGDVVNSGLPDWVAG